ncbi:aminoglycoside phosphotransferase family protein [Virgibacillus sp. MSJ-26]|uniref:aminoglycoside phosphotransferase family protein n=1 Tax=Virgibacillus sp. MSJ-26 TaxID=2841522 RepID=UPI001C0F89DE|nr:aminoglycoside phosphotransferase family protein [Virgibacillus sp. MSJ-26]MBU5466197.1 aminoglycoside phosphotransferase family protein [Virgibacillus sp. MSJ-26]
MLSRILHQFKLSVLSINEVEDSHSSTVYKCALSNGEKIYLKIPYTKLKYQRELEAYEILEGRVSIPRMLDYWSGDEDCPGAFLLSELKGTPLTPKASPKIAFQVGVLHASMHQIQPSAMTELTGIKNEFPNWFKFIERQFYSFAEDAREVLDERLYKLAIEKFEMMKRQLPPPDGSSFVHMDFRPANIIVDDNEVAGVIDFESVRFGSTDIDFTKLYRDFLRFDFNLYHSYQEGYKGIRPLIDLEVVLPFYLFTDAFNSIGWCKRRGVEKHALFLEENIIRLKNILL